MFLVISSLLMKTLEPRLVLLTGVQQLLVTGFHFLFSAMIPHYWLTEGGQSATGALLDHVVENHVAATHLSNRAASQHVSLYELLNKILESTANELKAPFLASLTKDLHVLPDFHGNRSPIADPKSKGMLCGLTLDTSERQLALLYLATLQGIAYGTRHIVEHCNAHGHKVHNSLLLGSIFWMKTMISHRSWRRAFFVDRSSWKLPSLNAVEVSASVFRLQPIRAAVMLLIEDCLNVRRRSGHCIPPFFPYKRPGLNWSYG
ncbi:Ribulokinase [Nymphaea thermarum]|nr:Ribulokinase [Nymphaea thermarum]